LSTGLDAQQQMFSENPDNRRAFEALEEHFFLEGDWKGLANLYRRRISAASIVENAQEQVRLLFRLGQILEERLVDLEAASEVYWKLATLDPSNRPALRQLRGIHEQREQWDLFLQIAELEAQTEMPSCERAVFEAELGRCWQNQFGDPDEALRAFERSLAADPEYPDALEGLAMLHREAGHFEKAATLLEHLTDRIRGPERAPIWIALGKIFAGPLEEPVRAIRCFEAALDDDPFQTPAVESLQMLEAAAENWDAVGVLLERRFDLAAGAQHRAAIAVEASQIQLNYLGSAAAARAWVNRALELAPDELSVLGATAEVDRADRDDEALLKTLNQLFSVAGQRVPRALLIEAAQLQADSGDLETALETICSAIEMAGENSLELLSIQAGLLRALGSKRELAEVLETLTALDGFAEDLQLADSLRELARIREDDLADAAGAQTAWQRAFDLDPRSDESQGALERIYRKANDWDALRGTFETAINARGSSGHAALSAALGLLLLDILEDEAGARSCFEAAIADDDRCRPALAGLQRIAERTQDPDLLLDVCERRALDCEDGDEMARLARTCIPILEARDSPELALEWAMRWHRMAPGERQALEWRAGFEARLNRGEAELESLRALAPLQEGRKRASNQRRQADLHLELDDASAASAALELSLESEPGNLEALTTLSDMYRDLGRPADEARSLRQWADALPQAEQAPVLEKLANLLHDPLGDLDTAIVVRWRLVEQPGAPEDAQQKLEALLELTGRYAELVQLLNTTRARLGDESPQALEIDRRRARLLLDSLGQCEEAAEIFAALHEREPDDEVVLEGLERALRMGDDARGLCDLLERRAGWESDAERRTAMLFERASLLEEALAEPTQACDLYQAIVEQEAGSDHAPRALARLESLLEAQGEWSRLRSLLCSKIESTPAAETVTLRERIAQICHERLGDMAGCAEQLEAIAETGSDQVHVWQRLEEIYRRELDRPADWLRVVEAELAAEPSDERESALSVGAARLLLDDERRPRDRDASEALGHYRRVLELNPNHSEAAEVLSAHYGWEGRYEGAAEILEARLEGLADSEVNEKNDLRLRLADLLSNRLEQKPRALALYEAARETLGAIPKIAEPLAELYEHAGRFEALNELAREVLNGAEADREAVAWQVRLATSQRALGQLDAAAATYRTALEASPDDRGTQDALIEIYDEAGEFELLAGLLEKQLPFAQVEEAIELRLRLARLHADGNDDPAAALEQLERVLDVDPEHRDAFGSALELANRIGDPKRLLALLDRALTTTLTALDRAELLERRGLLIVENLEDPEQALPCFREAIALDPTRDTARMALRVQLECCERWPAVLDCLFVEASRCDAERRIELYERAAQIAWSHISPDASLPWLARLRQERPEDPELLSRLAEIHGRAGRWEATLRALDEELALRPRAEDQRRLHVDRARLLERELHAPSRAVLAYQKALESGSAGEQRDTILTELDRLYAQLDRPLERAEILEARVADLDGESGIALRQTLASIYYVDLSRPDLAIRPLLINVHATRDEPTEQMTHLGALDAALRAGARHDVWARAAEYELELIDAHRDVRESTPEDYQRFLREELARAYDEELGNADRAIEHLRILAARDGDSSHNGERLRELLRRTGRLPELATRLTAHLERDGSRSAEWLELGLLREEQLHDLPGALEAFREATNDDQLTLDAIRGLRRCHERLRDWGSLADTLEAELGQTLHLSAAQRAATARRLGDVCRDRLGATERAVGGYECALELEPDDLVSLRALTRIKRAGQDTQATHALYRRELELLGDDREDSARAREVWLLLASDLHQDSQAAREALEAYQSAAAIERLDTEDQLRLARLHETLDEFEAFGETYGQWCDRADSNAGVGEHLELALHLAKHDQGQAARARAERATVIDPSRADAWACLARLEADAGRNEVAADGFIRAADEADSQAAAEFCVEAAACLDASDGDRACDLLSRAVAHDPACQGAQIALARASASLGRDEDTLRAAECALELAENQPLDDAVRMDLAMLGGRAAPDCDENDARRRLLAIVLEIDPDQIEALEMLARVDFESGDYRAARIALTHRIELEGANPNLARHLTVIARGLEADELFDGAWSRYEEAIAIDGQLDAAHEGLVRVHERAARTEEALRCLERWASADSDPTLRAQAALRAAEHALAIGDKRGARQNLENATRLEPELAPAWLLLCGLVGETGPDPDTRRLCDEALEAIEPGPHSAQIALQSAKLAELDGNRRRARERYAEASRWEPRCVDAVLAESRLARASGDWVEAEGVLSHFLEAHPDPESPSLGQVHFERGRLLSGPLERFEEATGAYESALALQPELHVARAALADLLEQAPDRWAEALALHREILTASPTASDSLRALVQIAQQRGQPEVGSGALAVLLALGQASPAEAATAPSSLPFAVDPGPAMAEIDAEHLRRLAHLLRDELAQVIGAPESPHPELDEPEIEKTRQQILSVEEELSRHQILSAEDELSAPGIGSLEAGERASLFTTIASFLIDPTGDAGDTGYREALGGVVGRWTRRKARRIVEKMALTDIENLDHAGWGFELRAMAAAQVIDRNEGDLRSVLRALLVLETASTNPGLLEDAELGTLASTSGTAQRLLTRITTLLCEKLETGH